MAVVLKRRTGSSASESKRSNQARRTAETRGRPGGIVERRGVWVYAVAERVPAAPLSQLRGVGGGPVRTIAAAGLAAVAEDVGLAEFGEEALRRNLEDLAWLEATARAHHRIIDAVAQRDPLVPMRLATVYSSDAGVTAVLAGRNADFRTALLRISGRKEWGVKAYAVRRSEPGGTAADSSGSAIPGGGAGTAYLRRRRDQLAAQKNAGRETQANVQIIHAELSRHAAGSRLHPPHAPQLGVGQERMVLNAAYLLDEERTENFGALVLALGQHYPHVRLELTGPWPPYSFTGTGEEHFSELEA
jgi:Gas vesicle synthesis protein GvpL/GvpF